MLTFVSDQTPRHNVTEIFHGDQRWAVIILCLYVAMSYFLYSVHIWDTYLTLWLIKTIHQPHGVQPGEIRFLVSPIRDEFGLGILTGWSQFGASGFLCRLTALCPEAQKHPGHNSNMCKTVRCVRFDLFALG